MIKPGETYTYEFEPTRPGTFYYHCHSADGGHHITEHMHQGLYGAILIHDKDEPPHPNEQVLFMGEMGFDTEGKSVPPYIMNGLGLPGGEHALEDVFKASGIQAVAAQFNKTLAVIEDSDSPQEVSFISSTSATRCTPSTLTAPSAPVEQLNGESWPANVVRWTVSCDTVASPLRSPALWLFHCHVVSHADAGMIGLLNVTGPPTPSPGSQ